VPPVRLHLDTSALVDYLDVVDGGDASSAFKQTVDLLNECRSCGIVDIVVSGFAVNEYLRVRIRDRIINSILSVAFHTPTTEDHKSLVAGLRDQCRDTIRRSKFTELLRKSDGVAPLDYQSLVEEEKRRISRVACLYLGDVARDVHARAEELTSHLDVVDAYILAAAESDAKQQQEAKSHGADVLLLSRDSDFSSKRTVPARVSILLPDDFVNRLRAGVEHVRTALSIVTHINRGDMHAVACRYQQHLLADYWVLGYCYEVTDFIVGGRATRLLRYLFTSDDLCGQRLDGVSMRLLWPRIEFSAISLELGCVPLSCAVAADVAAIVAQITDEKLRRRVARGGVYCAAIKTSDDAIEMIASLEKLAGIPILVRRSRLATDHLPEALQ